MVIESATEFISLRASGTLADNDRASAENAAEEIWLEILRDYPDMAFSVALNKTLQSSILEVLATNPNPRVRWVVAEKRRASGELLDRMAADGEEIVRIAVARNRNTRLSTLNILTRDTSNVVRDIALNRVSKPQ